MQDTFARARTLSWGEAKRIYKQYSSFLDSIGGRSILFSTAINYAFK